MQQLGIVSEIDLRNSSENLQIVITWLRNYICPFTNNGDGMYSYSFGLFNSTDIICSVFKALADKRNYPLILHCRIGADLTDTLVSCIHIAQIKE
ncbi:MAG: tyrosine-protein phosphatase [Chitinispirillaceae bacterium]|nr:tyrosine-protein phosphatase [Chitinispirillaceae bacterium]